jgi:D-amino-acid dehydrogenase
MMGKMLGMKILILGSGVIGTTTAWYLAKAGHKVTVIDRQAGPALETSFGNAGEISPGYSSPWAGPGVPEKAVKWVLMRHGPLRIVPQVDPAMWRWCLSMLANCNADAYARNKRRMVRLAEYSRDQMIALRRSTGVAYAGRQQGTLQLFRTQKQLDGSAADIKVLDELGVSYELLDRAGCITAEPGLAHAATPLVGGLRLPNDETGDCHLFTTRLAALAAAEGVTFRFGVTIDRLEVADHRVTGVMTNEGLIEADRYVVALGSYSPLLLKPIGIDLPVYPIKGYSITVPVVNDDRAPVSTVLDETYKVATTRLADRIRVGGTAEIAGYSTSLPKARKAPLVKSLTELFPGAGDLSAATFWSGLRPMTPDGTPVIGQAGPSNLYLNTGHGTLGWTMAAGSGRVLADLLSGRPAEIETSDLALSRYAL